MRLILLTVTVPEKEIKMITMMMIVYVILCYGMKYSLERANASPNF